MKPQQQSVDIKTLQANFQKAVQTQDQTKIVSEGTSLATALRSRKEKPENPDPILDNPDAIDMKIADAHRGIGVANKNFRDVLTAWQQYHTLSKSEDKAIAASATAAMDPTGKDVAKFASDSSQHPFIATGYSIVNFLVRMTGSVPTFSYWFAMLILGVMVRLLAWPLAAKQYMGFKRMGLLQPMIKELQAKYQGQELQTRTMKLYQQYGINPLAGCWPMFIQLPFFIWIYQCVYAYQPEFVKGQFLWISQASHASNPFFGASLAERDVLIIIFYGISMVVSTMLTPTDPTHARQARLMGLSMAVLFSVMMLFYPLPSAFIFYWICINMVSTAQSLLFSKIPVPPLDENHGNKSGKGFFNLMTPKDGANGEAQPIKTLTKTGTPVLHKPKSPKPKKRKK